MDIQQVKQRFEIIGNTADFNRSIEIAIQVAPTDLSVLITGESGVGKERFPQIIHQYSHRKHAPYVAVNCGAIPEGTIDSELFGHEKGAFTGAHEKRKGYFEVANGGTIFLDEVGELPLSTQVRLLRVLEAGEFMKVGSSSVEKTNVRIVAATNVNIGEAIKKNKFREDLFYRLNTVPIRVPALRERQEDIPILFRKFSADFSEKYRMPMMKLSPEAQKALMDYRWPGNIRQLKNITEQISVIEKDRLLHCDTLSKYLPSENNNLPAVYNDKSVDEKTFQTEREILYKILFDLKKEVDDLKSSISNLITQKTHSDLGNQHHDVLKSTSEYNIIKEEKNFSNLPPSFDIDAENTDIYEDTETLIEESLSIEENEKELIVKALEKNKGKRKWAAKDLGISERTLYRKIKEYNIE